MACIMPEPSTRVLARAVPTHPGTYCYSAVLGALRDSQYTDTNQYAH